MIDTPKPESFEDFKKSFSYGSRTDLNFKFLAKLSDDQAAKFFQDLLWKLGDAFDDGNFAQIVDHVCEWQKRAYFSEDKKFTYDDGPFNPFQKRVADSRLVLITSTGHFVEGKDPAPLGAKNMTQQEAIEKIAEFVREAPQLSTLPVDTPADRLRVRHGGYDIRGVQADPNVAFPLQRLLELEHEGAVGQLIRQAYSFVGACSQKRLLKQTGPQWIEIFKQQPIDAALLVPVWPVCHVSVGHVARLLEAAGISTVTIAARAFRDHLAKMTLPRVVTTPYPMGRPLGAPGDHQSQRASILSALDLLESAKQVGTILDLPGSYTSVEK